jgi:CRP-like cAMP-binding protein
MTPTPSPFFLTLDEQTQQKMHQFTKRVRFKKGEVLFTQGELNHYFYVVQKGKIKNYQLHLESGKEQTLFIFREGDMFDTITLLDGKSHDVMYEALEESDLIEMPIAFVRELIEHNPTFNQKFFPYLAQQMRHIESLSSELSLYSTQERLIKLLLQNLDPSHIFRYRLIQGLSNKEIANLIGTVRHVVERHLKQLKADGLIEPKSKILQIESAKKLLEKINLL